MNSAQFIITMFHGFGGKISGKTLLQKRAFFVSLLSGIDPGLGFDAHYYGPYSSAVDSTVSQLKDMGFLQEEVSDFGVMSGGFEMRRFDYSLTEQGEQIADGLKMLPEPTAVLKGIESIIQAGDPNYVELSIAAKAYFIVSKQKRPMSVSEITKEAEKYNWNIGEQSLRKAVDFLRTLGVAKDAATAST